MSCFYFCPRFYRAFKEENITKDSIVLQLYPYEEIVVCCCICHKKICLISSRFEDDLSDRFFNELKKLLIQYFLLQQKFKVTMFVSTLYLCNATIAVIEHNNVLAEHGRRFFSDGSSNVIFICVTCLSYFISTFQATNFCFEELKKCLSEKYFKIGEDLVLPTEFEQLT